MGAVKLISWVLIVFALGFGALGFVTLLAGDTLTGGGFIFGALVLLVAELVLARSE